MKRVTRKVAGYGMIAAGTIMIFTPGPGLVSIVGGLALLADDVEWAGRAADWLKARAGRRDDASQDGG